MLAAGASSVAAPVMSSGSPSGKRIMRILPSEAYHSSPTGETFHAYGASASLMHVSVCAVRNPPESRRMSFVAKILTISVS